MAVTLSGVKRWRLGEIPRQTPRTHGQFYADGSVYNPDFLKRLGVSKWSPTYEVEVKAGEALFFPPGFIHETLNIDRSAPPV